MTLDRLQEIFRWRKRMDELAADIKKSEQMGGTALPLRIEQAALNLEGFVKRGVYLNFGENEIGMAENAADASRIQRYLDHEYRSLLAARARSEYERVLSGLTKIQGDLQAMKRFGEAAEVLAMATRLHEITIVPTLGRSEG